MKKILSFKLSREGPLYVYHYLNASDEKLVINSFPKKIDQKWWSNWDFRPFELYNVSGLSPVQNAIYLAIAWKLTFGMHRLGIPLWTKVDQISKIDKSVEYVKWDYSISDDEIPWNIVDQGFVHTLSNSKQKEGIFTKKLKFEQSRFAGLFILRSFKEFIDIQKPSLVNASSETNYFGFLGEKGERKLVKTLNSPFQPKLAKILEAKDIFINIYLGLDIGYPDSVLIKTKFDISSQLDILVNEYRLSIEKFEARMNEVYEMNDFTNAITDLLNL